MEIDRRKVERFIREEVELRTAQLEQERRRLKALSVGIDKTLINAMETKDDFLRGHSEVFTTLQRVVLRRKTLTFIDDITRREQSQLWCDRASDPHTDIGNILDMVVYG